MKMAILKTATILLALAAAASAQTWPHLRLHFPVGLTDDSYIPQPLTAAEAEEAGWVRLSGCGEVAAFEGERWAQDPSSDDGDDVVLLFDVNGYLAGAQTAVTEADAEGDAYFPFSTSRYYVEAEHPSGSGPAYYNTVYFVPVDIICTVGRTQEEFEQQGAGSTVLIQSGPDPYSVMQIPLTDQDMKASNGLDVI